MGGKIQIAPRSPTEPCVFYVTVTLGTDGIANLEATGPDSMSGPDRPWILTQSHNEPNSYKQVADSPKNTYKLQVRLPPALVQGVVSDKVLDRSHTLI
jgi:hypothetical protein